MADADEATNALIAKMLAEDEAYDDVYGIGYDEESEEEWGRKKKKKKRGGGGKGGSGGSAKRRKPKEVDPNQEYTETGRKKRKDAGKARTAPRAWNEEEERLFREALRLYGRSWKECAAHVGTRDQRSFTSHAQKYFIKMCLQGKPLPRKVAESGEGYTLSGKPLDPNSAAARAYGFKPDTLDKLMEAGGLASGSIEVGGDGKLTSGLADGGVGEGADELPVPTSAAAAAANKENLGGPNGETMPGVGREAKPKAKPRRRPKEEPALVEPVEPTEYAKNRPRRENAGKGGKATYQSYMSGGLNQIPCRDFTGVVGSVGTSSQPFFVEISDEAQLVADFHAHLSKYEVIGYLGGEWDPASRRLTIRRAFPCKGLEGTQQTDSCEMDPASEIEAKQKMDDWGLQVVGWYHSHPTFKPNPSEKDIENQENFQALFRDEGTKQEPFVGMIFSPYDVRLPDRESRRETFWVRKGAQGYGEVGPSPMRMRGNRKPIAGAVTEDTKACMRQLVEGNMIQGKVDLTELWRPFTRLNGTTPEGGPVTKLAKMRGALGAYLPETDDSEDFLDDIFKVIQGQKSWGADLGY